MESPALLELHYYLKDESHSIDALLLNKCESEALGAFLYIADELGFDVVLEATTATEGGYRQILKFVKNPKNAVVTGVIATSLIGGATVATSLLNTLITAVVAIWVAPVKPNPGLEALQEELLRRSIEEKKLDIKLKELGYEAALAERASKQSTPSQSPQELDQQDPDEIDPNKPVRLQMDLRVITRRSNYFKLLQSYGKVTGLGLGWIPSDSSRIVEQKYIPISQFIDFIRPIERIEPKEFPNAIIEIVSPVLKSNEMKWRGTYEGDSISFSMKDSDFKEDVWRKGVQFQSGDAIDCFLCIEQKINEVGEQVIAGYEVRVVHRLFNSARAEGAGSKFKEKAAPDQLRLDLHRRDDE